MKLTRFIIWTLLALTVTAFGQQTQTIETTPINRGERGVFYAWVDLAKDVPVPKSVRHELSFEPAKGGGAFTTRAAEAPMQNQLRNIAPPLACQDVPFVFERFVLQGRARELKFPAEIEWLKKSG